MKAALMNWVFTELIIFSLERSFENEKITCYVGCVTVAINFACADEGSNDGSEICRAQGGVEIQVWGSLKGVDVEDVVVCSILPSNMSRVKERLHSLLCKG
ncbi:hypothetical protein P4050_24905 [Pseudomonas aeruginosa]|nr:hypothetical protein [Pseudomonas aeruginosa]